MPFGAVEAPGIVPVSDGMAELSSVEVLWVAVVLAELALVIEVVLVGLVLGEILLEVVRRRGFEEVSCVPQELIAVELVLVEVDGGGVGMVVV